MRIHDVGKYALWIWWGFLGILPRRAAGGKKSTLHSFLVTRTAFSSALHPVYRERLSSRPVLTSFNGWVLGDVRDDIAYNTRLEVSPTGICSFLEG